MLDPQAPPPACEFVKKEAKLPMGGWRNSPTDARVQAVLRNDAAEMGADTVTVTSTGGHDWYVKYYRCGAR